MNLLKIKDCAKCKKALVYGRKDSLIIECNSVNSVDRDLFKDDGRCCAAYCSSFEKSDILNRNGAIPQEKALRFMLAGNAEFVLNSTKTNEDFMFRLTRHKKSGTSDELIFVNTTKASENIYCGTMWFDKKLKQFKYAQGKKGKMPGTSIDIRSLMFVLNKLYNKEHVNYLDIYSVGKCGCCGKPLETQSEINNGVHETCEKSLDFGFIES